MNRTAKIVATFGLALGCGLSAGGCLVTARGHMGVGTVVAYEEPPPPRAEAIEVRAGFVWVKGRHDWRNNRWQWTPGHWERERAGYAWQDGRWEHRGSSWHWIDGEWVVGGRATVVVNNDIEPPRERVRDHRGEGNHHPGHGGNVDSQVRNPDGSGVDVVVGGGHVQVNVIGPTQAPPPVRMETPGRPKRGFVWIGGHYEWRDSAYAWIDGHWERAKAKQVWIDGRWDLQGNVYVWTPGHWGSAGSR